MAITKTTNQLQNKPTKQPFSLYISGETANKIVSSALRDPKEQLKFISNVSSMVANNSALARCENSTIVTTALLAHTLNLPMTPALGYFHALPFKVTDKNTNEVKEVCTPVIGYKGLIQLAIRSGQYKRIICLEVKEGELIKWDKVTEEIELKPIEDDSIREQTPTVGYVGAFQLINGFVKTIYWTKEKMEHHAKTYSNAYAYDLKKGWSTSFWSKDFDAQALKTILRQLLTKWGILSVEMQTAFERDLSIQKENGDIDYVDNSDNYEVATDSVIETETYSDVSLEEQQALFND